MSHVRGGDNTNVIGSHLAKRIKSDGDESWNYQDQHSKPMSTDESNNPALVVSTPYNSTPLVNCSKSWQQLKLQLATERQRQQVQAERKALEQELGSAGGPDDLRGHAWYHGGKERGVDRAEAERLLIQCVAEEHNDEDVIKKTPAKDMDSVETDTDSDSSDSDHQDSNQRSRRPSNYYYCFLVRESTNLRPPGRYVLSCLRVDKKFYKGSDGEFTRKQRRHKNRKQSLTHVLHFIINEIRTQAGTVYERAQYSFSDNMGCIFEDTNQIPAFDTVPGLIRYYVGGSGDSAVLSYGGTCRDDSIDAKMRGNPPTQVRIKFPCNRRRPLSAPSNPAVSFVADTAVTESTQVPSLAAPVLSSADLAMRAMTLPRSNQTTSLIKTSSGTLGRPAAVSLPSARVNSNRPTTSPISPHKDNNNHRPRLPSRTPLSILPRTAVSISPTSPPVQSKRMEEKEELQSCKRLAESDLMTELEDGLLTSSCEQYEIEKPQKGEEQQYMNQGEIVQQFSGSLTNKEDSPSATLKSSLSRPSTSSATYQERYASDLERFVQEEQRRHLKWKYDTSFEQTMKTQSVNNTSNYSNVTRSTTSDDVTTYSNIASVTRGNNIYTNKLPTSTNSNIVSGRIYTSYSSSNSNTSVAASNIGITSTIHDVKPFDSTELSAQALLPPSSISNSLNYCEMPPSDSNNTLTNIPFTRSGSFRSNSTSSSISHTSNVGGSLPRHTSSKILQQQCPTPISNVSSAPPLTPPHQQSTNGVCIAYRYKLPVTLGEAGSLTIDDRVRSTASANDLETRARQERCAERVLPRLLRSMASAVNINIEDEQVRSAVSANNSTAPTTVLVQPSNFDDPFDTARQPPWERQRRLQVNVGQNSQLDTHIHESTLAPIPFTAERPVLSSFDPPDRFHSLLLPNQQILQKEIRPERSRHPPVEEKKRISLERSKMRELVQQWLLDEVYGRSDDKSFGEGDGCDGQENSSCGQSPKNTRSTLDYNTDGGNNCESAQHPSAVTSITTITAGVDDHDSSNKDTQQQSSNISSGERNYTKDCIADVDIDNYEVDNCCRNRPKKGKTSSKNQRSGVAATLRAIHLAIIDDSAVMTDSGAVVNSSAVAGSRRLAAMMCRWDSRTTVLPYKQRRRKPIASGRSAAPPKKPTNPLRPTADPETCPLQLLGSPSLQGRRARLDVIERFACIQYLVSLTIIVTPCLLLLKTTGAESDDDVVDIRDSDDTLQIEYSRRRRLFYYRCAGGGAIVSNESDSSEDSSYDDEDSKNTIHQKISKQLDKQNQKKKIKQTNQIQLFDDIDWLAERRFWRSELAAKRASALDKWIRTAADARQSAGDMFAWSSLMAALCSPRIQAMHDAWSALRRTCTHSAFAFESKLRPEYLREQNLATTTNRGLNCHGIDKSEDNQAEDHQLPPNATVPDPMAIALLYEHLYNNNDDGYNSGWGETHDDDSDSSDNGDINISSCFTSPLLDGLDCGNRHNIIYSNNTKPKSLVTPTLSYQNGTDFGLRAVHAHCTRYAEWVRCSTPNLDIDSSTTRATSVTHRPMLLDRFRSNVRALLREYSDDDDLEENEYENEEDEQIDDEDYLHYVDFREYTSNDGPQQDCSDDDEDDRHTVICTSDVITPVDDIDCTTPTTSTFPANYIHSTPSTTKNHPVIGMTPILQPVADSTNIAVCSTTNNKKAKENSNRQQQNHNHVIPLRRLLLSHVFRTELHVRLFWPPCFSLPLNEHHQNRSCEPWPAYAMGTYLTTQRNQCFSENYQELLIKQLDAVAVDMRHRYCAMDAFLDGACEYYAQVESEDQEADTVAASTQLQQQPRVIPLPRR